MLALSIILAISLLVNAVLLLCWLSARSDMVDWCECAQQYASWVGQLRTHIVRYTPC